MARTFPQRFAPRARITLAWGLSLLIPLCAFTSCDDAENQARIQRRADSLARELQRKDSILNAEAQRERERQQEAQRQLELERQRAAAKRFHVILGSFRVPENAVGFRDLQSRQHPEAKIFDAPNGFKLVSIADFESMSEAVAYIIRVQNGQEEPDEMWVFEEGGPYDTSAYLEALASDM